MGFKSIKQRAKKTERKPLLVIDVGEFLESQETPQDATGGHSLDAGVQGGTTPETVKAESDSLMRFRQPTAQDYIELGPIVRKLRINRPMVGTNSATMCVVLSRCYVADPKAPIGQPDTCTPTDMADILADNEDLFLFIVQRFGEVYGTDLETETEELKNI